MGIVWVSVLLDSMIEEGRAEGPVRVEHLQLPEDEQLVLVKKKRSVLRENYKIRPALQTISTAAVEVDKAVPFTSDHEVPRDLIHHHSDGYYSLTTGLSPPAVLS